MYFDSVSSKIIHYHRHHYINGKIAEKNQFWGDFQGFLSIKLMFSKEKYWNVIQQYVSSYNLYFMLKTTSSPLKIFFKNCQNHQNIHTFKKWWINTLFSLSLILHSFLNWIIKNLQLPPPLKHQYCQKRIMINKTAKKPSNIHFLLNGE